MESSGGPAASARKLRRVMRAVYVVLVKQHQPKLAALGVHLHRMLSGDRYRRGLSLSCRAMDPAAAVVHPLPRGHGGGHRRRPSVPATGSLSSLSCRSMDPAAAVRQYQYRPREVQFSCKSTPLHKRRRAQRRAMRLQQHDLQGRDQSSSETEFYGTAAAVTRLFALMDVEEATDVVDIDDDDGFDVSVAGAAAGEDHGLAVACEGGGRRGGQARRRVHHVVPRAAAHAAAARRVLLGQIG